MSFTINAITANPPVGSLMKYFGTTDPSGWVICDGEERDNSTGLYNTLISLGIGTTSNTTTYIPPNLKNKMLYGSSDGVTQSTGGNSTVALSESNLPSHNHSISISDTGHSHNVATTSYQKSNYLDTNINQVWGPWSGNNGVVLTAQHTTTGISASAGYIGSGSSFSILPPYVTVNFILKI